jgi:hypothetical protein
MINQALSDVEQEGMEEGREECKRSSCHARRLPSSSLEVVMIVKTGSQRDRRSPSYPWAKLAPRTQCAQASRRSSLTGRNRDYVTCAYHIRLSLIHLGAHLGTPSPWIPERLPHPLIPDESSEQAPGAVAFS